MAQSKGSKEIPVNNRSPDFVAENSSHWSSKENQLKQLAGDKFESRSSEQEFTKAARKGDYVRVYYRSSRSGNTLTREGWVSSGFTPTSTSSTGSNYIYVDDQDSGKTLSVRSDGYTSLKNPSARPGDGKKRRQKLGKTKKVELWYSKERRKKISNGEPVFNRPVASPGDSVRFVYKGETRVEEVWKVRKDHENDCYRYKLYYSHKREDKEEPSWISEANYNIEKVETVGQDDYGVSPDEWKMVDRSNGEVVIAGLKNGIVVAQRTFELKSTQVRLPEEGFVDSDDTGEWEKNGDIIQPTTQELRESDSIEEPVEK